MIFLDTVKELVVSNGGESDLDEHEWKLLVPDEKLWVKGSLDVEKLL